MRAGLRLRAPEIEPVIREFRRASATPASLGERQRRFASGFAKAFTLGRPRRSVGGAWRERRRRRPVDGRRVCFNDSQNIKNSQRISELLERGLLRPWMTFGLTSHSCLGLFIKRTGEICDEGGKEEGGGREKAGAFGRDLGRVGIGGGWQVNGGGGGKPGMGIGARGGGVLTERIIIRCLMKRSRFVTT